MLVMARVITRVIAPVIIPVIRCMVTVDSLMIKGVCECTHYHLFTHHVDPDVIPLVRFHKYV